MNKLKKTLVKFSVYKFKRKFIVYQNLNDEFNIALQSWILRTSEHTKESLCEYINNKHTEYRCEIKQDYGKL